MGLGEHTYLSTFTPAQRRTALTKVFSRVALSSRRQAMLQTIDALRGYAAAHDGKLPASIDELKETPAPIDPVTGNPFDYSTSGSEATLSAAALKDMTTSEPHRIHITIGKR